MVARYDLLFVNEDLNVLMESGGKMTTVMTLRHVTWDDLYKYHHSFSCVSMTQRSMYENNLIFDREIYDKWCRNCQIKFDAIFGHNYDDVYIGDLMAIFPCAFLKENAMNYYELDEHKAGIDKYIDDEGDARTIVVVRHGDVLITSQDRMIGVIFDDNLITCSQCGRMLQIETNIPQVGEPSVKLLPVKGT